MAPGVGADLLEARERAASNAPPTVDGDGVVRQRNSKSSSNGSSKMVNGDCAHDGDDAQLDFDVEIPGHEPMRQHPIAQDMGSLHQPHLPRANLAVSKECPFGTQTNNWAKQHRNYSTMQQHCLFFDPDNDGVIWPSDTFRGLWQLGYPVIVIVWATVIIHAGFSWFSSDNWLLPDPLFRLTLKNVHRSKHGSDTHVFDQEGRFHPALFENIFTKYDRERKGGLTFMDGMRMLYGNRVVADFAGYLAGFVEWVLTYLLVAKDGVVYKDDLRKVYDGSIFFEIAGRKDGHY